MYVPYESVFASLSDGLDIVGSLISFMHGVRKARSRQTSSARLPTIGQVVLKTVTDKSKLDWPRDHPCLPHMIVPLLRSKAWTFTTVEMARVTKLKKCFNWRDESFSYF